MGILIVVLVLASILTTAWLVLLHQIKREDWIDAAYNKVLDNLAKTEKLQRKDEEKQKKLAEYHGIPARVMKLFLGGNANKEIAKLEKQNERLQNGNLKSVSLLAMPGYVLLRKYDAIGHSVLNKKILLLNTELSGRKYAENRTKGLMAKMLSYPIMGVALSLVFGILLIGAGEISMGFMILGIGSMIVMLLAYSLYDGLRAKSVKRHEAIVRQFPNVVSKLALLVSSGMIMDRAWKETAYSQNSEIYKEMQITSEELDNLVSPEAAYGGFINRCGAKETAKLASAIMQNLSKGNAEIGRLLKELAKESWSERRHTAKRDAEKANSKLLIPTMMLFAAILIMIMAPLMMNFGGL